MSSAGAHYLGFAGTTLRAARDHRMEEMAPKGLYDPEDTDALIDQVTRFVVGGFEVH